MPRNGLKVWKQISRTSKYYKISFFNLRQLYVIKYYFCNLKMWEVRSDHLTLLLVECNFTLNLIKNFSISDCHHCKYEKRKKQKGFRGLLNVFFLRYNGLNETFYAISHQLYNLKNMKNTHGGVLLLVKLHAEFFNFTKSNTPPRVTFTFFKLYKWYQIAQSVSNIRSFTQ